MKEESGMIYNDGMRQIKAVDKNQQDSGITTFFWGFITGVLSCLADGAIYYLLRRVQIKTGGYNGN
jgi:hypothetical protein